MWADETPRTDLGEAGASGRAAPCSLPAAWEEDDDLDHE
jgi:hypothetical protein